MRRAYWSADFAEAHVVEAMLCAHGVNAYVFDAQMVRQDWFRTLALGGYRVMVADSDATRAAELVGGYRAGTLAIDDDAVERPACPQCAAPGHDDPVPRRLAFALLIASEAVFTLWFMFATDATAMTLILCGSTLAIPAAALVLAQHIKGRYICSRCATRWRTRPAPFATMTREVQAAADGGPAP